MVKSFTADAVLVRAQTARPAESDGSASGSEVAAEYQEA
jgi:hypothetical protein